MLVSEKHSHPLIFVGGIEHEVLEALLDFIYCGEAKGENEHLNSFLRLSTNIQLVGVTTEAVKKKLQEKRRRKENKVCKHLNKGSCKNKKYQYA